MFVPQSLVESAINLNDKNSTIFDLLDMDSFRSMFNLVYEDSDKVFNLTNLLTCIVLSGVSAGKMCNMSVDSV